MAAKAKEWRRFDDNILVASSRVRHEPVGERLCDAHAHFVDDIDGILKAVADAKENPNGYSLDLVGHCNGVILSLGAWNLSAKSKVEIGALAAALFVAAAQQKPVTVVRLIGCNAGSAVDLRSVVAKGLQSKNVDAAVTATSMPMYAADFNPAGVKPNRAFVGLGARGLTVSAYERAQVVSEFSVDRLATRGLSEIEEYSRSFGSARWPLVRLTRAQADLVEQHLPDRVTCYLTPGLLAIPLAEYYSCAHRDERCECGAYWSLAVIDNGKALMSSISGPVDCALASKNRGSLRRVLRDVGAI